MSDISTISATSRQHDFVKQMDDMSALYQRLKAVCDETTRIGEAITITADVTMKIVTKVGGSALADHPYYSFHKTHIEVLAAVGNATGSVSIAVNAHAAGLKAAASTGNLRKQTAKFAWGIQALQEHWDTQLHGTLIHADFWAGDETMDERAASLKREAVTEEQIKAEAKAMLNEWRFRFAGLVDNSLKLYVMMRTEYAAVLQASQRYKRALATIQGSQSGITANVGVVAEYALRNRLLEEQFAHIKATGSDYDKVIREDALGYAKANLTHVQKIAVSIASAWNTARYAESSFLRRWIECTMRECLAAVRAA